MRILAAVAFLVALAHIVAAQPIKKQLKDQAEHDLYNRALNAEDPAREIEALEQWTQRYPASDYRDDRLYLFMQAYNKLDQPERVLDYGARLIARGLPSVFNTSENGLAILNVLFLIVRSTASLPSPTEAQVSLGQRAARDLLEFTATYRPANTEEASWPAARDDLEKRTRAAIVVMALAPGNQAMAKNPPDCAAAATAWTAAATQFPQNALIGYNLGKALHCEGKTAQGIYQFVRAAELDPSLGGSADPKEIAEYAARAYSSYHGNEEALDHLKSVAKTSPLPPPDFAIETAAEVAARKHNELIERNPQLALWLGIREQLASPNAVQYFDGQLKNNLVAGKGGSRAMKGTIVEGKPSCRPKELVLTMDGTAGPEVTLRLDSALAGVAVPGEIEFDAEIGRAHV